MGKWDIYNSVNYKNKKMQFIAVETQLTNTKLKVINNLENAK